ncbi:hypothetical protein DM992_00065 [Burkholderia sp. JP2-270]|nr:hypothetical protein DM992_00065 [Burkholderia sp. JP2-270]
MRLDLAMREDLLPEGEQFGYPRILESEYIRIADFLLQQVDCLSEKALAPQRVKIDFFERRQMMPVIFHRTEHGDVERIEVAVFEESFCVVSFNARK